MEDERTCRLLWRPSAGDSASAAGNFRGKYRPWNIDINMVILETVYIDIDMVILLNINTNILQDSLIDIDRVFLKNIDINKGVFQNIDMDEILYW